MVERGKSRFIEMFGDPVTNPMGWEVKPYQECLTHANNGLSRRGVDADGNIVLRLVELQNGYIDYGNPNRIMLTDEEKGRFLLYDGDVLFARVNGNPDNVGRCASFVNIGKSVYHNDHIIRTSLNAEMLCPCYIVHIFNSEYGRSELQDKIKTSAGQYTVNQVGLGSVRIPLPPLELQNRFAAFVESTDKSKFTIKRGGACRTF